MKARKQNRFFLAALSLVGVTFAMPAAQAAAYYWDNNGATSGFGTAGGTWAAPTTNSGTQGWSTDATGATLPSGSTTTATSDSENFGTATAGLAGGTVIVGTVSAGNITFGAASGAIILSGGTITMGTSQIIVNNASDTIGSVLGGGNALTKAGTGRLILTGNNTRTSTLTLTAGTLNANASAAIGTGATTNTLIFNGGTLQAGGAITSPSTRGVTLTSTGLIDTNSNAVSIAGVMSGAGGLTKSGAGTLTLTGANTYTGVTTVSAGTLKLGSATALGTTAGNTTLASGATLDLSGQTIAEPFGTISGTGVGSGGALINSSGTAATITGTITGGNFTVGGSGNMTFSQVTGGAVLAKIGAATVTLGGTADNVSTAINANGGFVVLGKTSTTGVHAFGGASTIGVGGTIQLGGSGDYQMYGGTSLTVNSGGVLDLNGKNQNHNGLGGSLNLNGTGIGSGGALINSAAATTSTLTVGTDSLVLQSASSIGGPGNLLIAGGTGANGAISSTGALTKVGSGALTLTSATTYTGATSVNGGRLTVAGAGTLAGTSGLTVGNGAAFYYQPPTIGTTLALAAGSPLTLSDGSTLGLAWDSTTANKIATPAAATVGNVAGVLLDMVGSYTSGTTYTVLQAGSGLATGSYFVLNPTDYTAVVAKSDTAVTITPTTAGSTLTTAFWQGGFPGAPNVWAVSDGAANSNWVTAAAGGATGLVPGAGADVTFSATAVATPPTATVLGANMAIKTLTLADTTNGLGLNADGNTLTIIPGAATDGILMHASVPASAIGANVALGADQTWTNHSANPLTVGGAVSGAFALTKAGSGTLTLTGTNTYSGDTTVNAGTLQLGNGAVNGTVTSGLYPLADGTTLFLNNATAASAVTGGWATQIRGSGTLRLNSAQAVTGLANWGPNLATATPFDPGFTGTLQLDTGRIDSSPAGLGGITTLVINSGAQFMAWTGTYPQNFTLAGAGWGESGQPGALRVSGTATATFTGNITLSADAGLNSQGTGTMMTISGNITGGFGISKENAGPLILTGTNTYTGGTLINSGTLQFKGSASLPAASAVSLGSATLHYLDDGAGSNGTISRTGNAITLAVASTTDTISVGNNGGTTTGNTVAFGALNNGTPANAFSSTINFTGSNGYLQSFTSLGLSGFTGNGTTLNPTTTSVTILGNVTNQESGLLTGHYDTLTLGGTSTGNAINGVISDNADYVGPVGNGDTRVTKTGTSTWTLNGNNTYSGPTAISGGPLRITNALALGNTTSGTTQSGASALEIDGTGGAVVVGAEPLTINGGGITNFGALRNLAGNNTYGGTVTLAAQSRINSDLGTLTLNNATAVTGAAQNLVVGGAGTVAISGAITTTTGFVARDGSGTLTLAGTNTYTGATTASAGTISLTGSIASSNISTNGTGGFSESATGSIAGTGTFVQGSSGTSTLAGTNTFTGATTVSAGTLVLDYSTQDNGKLSDTAALVLGGTLDLKGGTHTEVVQSSTLTANTSSRVTSSTPGSVLQMNAITPGAGATIDFATDNIATTDMLNNASGVLGNWATVNGGIDLAMNSGATTAGGPTVPGDGVADGYIRAYTGYTDVTRRDGTPALQVIADAAASNVRIIEGTGNPANITLAAATTTIGTLTQSASGGTGAATINSGSGTLLTNAILVATGTGALTLGNGTLATATSGGDLALITHSANGLTIDSVIANNISASTLTKTGTGTLTLTAANTYSGATSIGAGTMTISGAGQLGSGTYPGAISSGTGSTLGYSSSADQTLAGAISGSGSLIKDTNSSNLSLAAGNTYTGNTTVNVGTLTLAGAAGVGTAGGYLYNGLTSSATVTVASGARIVISSNNSTVHNALGYGTNQTWSVAGTINSTGGDAHTLPGTLTLNNGTLTGVSNATFGTFLTNASYSVNLTANGNSNTISAANFGMPGPLALSTPLITDALSVSSGLGVTGQLTGALTKTGLGTVTLSGASIYTGATTVTAGTLSVTGSTNQGTATSDVLIANTATGNAVLTIQGAMTARYLSVGGVTGASGAVYMNSGTYTGGADGELGFTFGAGTTTGGYGYFGMTGGTVNTNRFQFGGQNSAAQNGVGVGMISGGTVTSSSYVILSRYGTTPGTIGSLTVATGGTLNHTSATGGQNLALGWQGAGRAELNLTGGTITSATGRVMAYGGGGATWTGTGIVNLNAGTLTTTAITTGGTGATSYLNFAGGTLKAVSAQGAFLPALTGVYVNGPFGSFNGGAVIDNNGVGITISAALIAPTGNGVSTIPVTNGGSGYIGAPAVTITDGGSGFGATAIANMVDDGTAKGTFQISSITITNPGNNYTAPAATLVGGGNGVASATLGTPTSAANTSGGLTKNGAGFLTLSGANTYTGVTTINAGTITANALMPSTSFVVNSGGQLYGGWAIPGATFTNNFTISGTGYLEGGINNGALRASNNQTFSGPISLAAASRIAMIETTAAATFSGQITGSYALDVQGAFNGSSGTQTFTLANPGTASDYSGNTSISAVDYGSARTGVKTILRLGSGDQLPNGMDKGNVVFNGADANHLTILELNGFNETINGLSNAAAVGAIIRNTSTGTAVLTIGDADTTSTFSGVIADDGAGKTLALTKAGTGSLTLSGANTYGGNTTVNAGTLTLSNASDPLNANPGNDASIVTLAATGATLDLTYTGTDKVDKLFIGTTQMAAGVYGKAGSALPVIGIAEITGDGTLTVGAFSSWIVGTFANGPVPLGKRGPNDDPDNDGISNLLEYAIASQDPTVGNAAVSTFTANTLSFTKRADTTGLTYAIVESSDLGVSVPWTEVPAGPSYTNNATTVSYTLTPGSPVRNFVRLKVTQAP